MKTSMKLLKAKPAIYQGALLPKGVGNALISIALFCLLFQSGCNPLGSSQVDNNFSSDGAGSGAAAGSTPALLTISGGLLFDFGSVTVNTTADNTFTVVNTGGTAVSLGTLDTSAIALAAPFTLTDGTCLAAASIAANGGSCTLVVTFSPVAASTSTDTITVVYNNGSTLTSVTGDITGTGITPASLAFSGLSGFGSITVGNTSSTQTITLTNSGATAASNVYVALSSGTQFAISTVAGTNTCGISGSKLSVAASGTCVFNLNFIPTSAGVKSDTITVTYDNGAATGQTQTATLSGTGVTAALLGISDGPTYTYATTGVSSTSSKTFTVTNSGGVTATLGTVTTAGLGLSAPFTLSGGTCSTGGSIAASGTCTIIVQFAPTLAATSTATISLSYNNGASTQTTSVDLSGTGVSTATLAFSTNTLDFGSVTAGSATTQSLTLTNSGTISGTSVFISISGTGYALSSNNCGTSGSRVTLVAGASCTFNAVLTAASTGTITGTVSLSYNNGSSTVTTPTVNLTASSSAAATAPPSTNLALWLKADALALNSGDVVASWNDSQNSNNATQSTASKKPIYRTNILNGKPVLRFDGSDDNMSIADHATLRPNTIGIVAAFKRNTASGNYAKLFVRPYYTNESWNSPYVSWDLEARYSNTNGVAFATSVAGTLNSQGSSAVTSDEFHIVTATQDGSAKDIYSDGVSVAHATLAGNIDNSNTGQKLYIGSNSVNGEYFNGDVAEILVYGTSSGAALSSANRIKAECYLNQKYNLRISTCPNLTPFRSTRAAATTFTFTASGGTAPYTYAVISGSGTISSSGLFTAPSSADTTTIQITDANGSTNIATVESLAASTPSLVNSGLVFNLDAGLGTGSAFAGSGCGTTGWFNVLNGALMGTLANFATCGSTTGWNGTGIATDPYRLTFDGTNDIVTLPVSATSGLTQFTASFWLRTTEARTNATYWNRPSLFGYGSSGSGDFGITTQGGAIGMWSGLPSGGGDNSTISSTSVNDNAWHHIAVTNDASTIRIYVDGQVPTSNSTLASGLAISGSGYFGIGGQYQDWLAATNYYHQGDIAQFAFYNVALSANDVARNCNALKSRFSGATCAAYSPPTQLVVSGPSLADTSGACSSAFTVTTKDGSGLVSKATSDVTVTMSGIGSSTLYSDANCTTSISSLTIAADSSTGTFYMKGGAVETLSVVANDASGILAYSSPLVVSVTDGDQYWPSVVLLMKMDGSGTTFTESKSGLTVTNSNSTTQVTGPTGFGNTAQFSASQKGLSVPDSSSWTIGTGSYTIEWRAKFTSLPTSGNSYIFLSTFRSGVDTNWDFFLNNDGTNYKLGLFHGRNAAGGVVNATYLSNALTGATAITTGTWYTFAFTYDGSNLRFFKDGVLVGTTAQTAGFGDSSTSIPLFFGSGYNLDYLLLGELDEVRITKGVCRYTTTYTPSSAPFKAY